MRLQQAFIGVALLALAGCERSVVEGRAVNAQGEALPGVVARLAGTDHQNLSDALGHYRMTAARGRGDARIQLSKSGYAPAVVTVKMSGRLRIRIPDTILWPLPLNPGVYTMKDGNYIGADWVLPKRYYLKEGSSAFGAELPGTLHASTNAADLFVVCYRTPRYNARLSRLAPAEATLPGLDSESLTIWVESGTIDAELEPVDQPEGQLLRIAVDRPLEPGFYGIHWGAMEGYTTLESRVYVFEIVAPPEPEPEDETAVEDEATSEEGTPGTKADAQTPVEVIEPAPDLLDPPDEEKPPSQR